MLPGGRALAIVVQEQVPERLLQCIALKLKVSRKSTGRVGKRRRRSNLSDAVVCTCLRQRRGLKGAGSWCKNNGTVDFMKLGTFIGMCEDESIKRSLTRLRKVLATVGERERIEVSRRSHVMCRGHSLCAMALGLVW